MTKFIYINKLRAVINLEIIKEIPDQKKFFYTSKNPLIYDGLLKDGNDYK